MASCVSILVVLSIAVIFHANLIEGKGKVLWHQYQPVHVFRGCEIVNNAYVMSQSGHHFDASAVVQVTKLIGSGEPDWSSSYADNVKICAAQSADVMVSLSLNVTSRTSTISVWHAGSSVPYKVIPIPGQSMAAVFHSVTLSRDGKILITALNHIVSETDYYSRVYHMDLTTSPPKTQFIDFPLGGVQEDGRISADGNIVASNIEDQRMYFYDFATKKSRGNFQLPSLDSTLCFSGDGNYFVYGWTVMSVWKFSPAQNIYVKVKLIPAPNGFQGSACSISDEYSMVVGWTRGDYLQKGASLFQLQGTNYTENWTYMFDESPANDSYQDAITIIKITSDGKYIAAGAWGNESKSTPTVAVWKSTSPTPAFTLISPGSTNDIDIKSVNGVAFVAAGGRHVHNDDTTDYGGDLYAITVQ